MTMWVDALSVLGAVMVAFGTLAGMAVGFHKTLRRWLKNVNRESFMEAGLIRYDDPGKPVQVDWPNGWDNLPDALEGINNKIERHHRK